MEPERIAKWVSLVNTALWTALLVVWIRNALVRAPPAVLLDLPLYPYPMQVEPVARYIVGALYAVFKWVLVAVVIISGIGAALGLVSEYIAFVGIRVPRATLRTLLSDVVQLVLMKIVVDAAIRYFGYATVAELEPLVSQLDAQLWGTWTGYATVALGALLGAWLVVRAVRGRGVIEIG
jgi:hypothetical protein